MWLFFEVGERGKVNPYVFSGKTRLGNLSMLPPRSLEPAFRG